MTNRKGWDSLSDSYRKRLSSNGISRGDYEQGSSLFKARGHKATPERKGSGYASIAKRTGITEVIPDFDDLEPDDRNAIAEDWVQGFMSRGQLKSRNANGKIERHASDHQIISRMDFLSFMEDYKAGMTADDWKAFREHYRSTFSAAA